MYSRTGAWKSPLPNRQSWQGTLPYHNQTAHHLTRRWKGGPFFLHSCFPSMMRLGWFHQEAQCQPTPSVMFSLAYPLPFPALVPAHYSHSTYSHGIAQYCCWNESSSNASLSGAGWQTENEQEDLGAADSFPQSRRRPGLPDLCVGCSGTISVALSCIWHLFALGWFSDWAKASVPLLVPQFQWHRLNPCFSQPLLLLSHAALIRVLLLWLTKLMFSRHIRKSGTQPSARAQILQQ